MDYYQFWDGGEDSDDYDHLPSIEKLGLYASLGKHGITDDEQWDLWVQLRLCARAACK